MTHTEEAQSTPYRLARVRGRSIGSLFFSIFGALWLLVGAYAFHHPSAAVALVLAVATLCLVSVAVSLLRSVPQELAHDPQRELDGRRFGWVNAGQGIAIFLAVQVANNLHHPNAACPAIALIVGLHFFVLPRSFRVRSNLITGAVITAGAVLCPLLFHGNALVGAVAVWTGATLWCSAGTALVSARRLRGTSYSMQALTLHGAA